MLYSNLAPDTTLDQSKNNDYPHGSHECTRVSPPDVKVVAQVQAGPMQLPSWSQGSVRRGHLGFCTTARSLFTGTLRERSEAADWAGAERAGPPPTSRTQALEGSRPSGRAGGSCSWRRASSLNSEEVVGRADLDPVLGADAIAVEVAACRARFTPTAAAPIVDVALPQRACSRRRAAVRAAVR